MISHIERNLIEDKLPSGREMAERAVLQLGGPTGSDVQLKDIQSVLASRLLMLMEGGDTNSPEYELHQRAQDLSTVDGLDAAINIFEGLLDATVAESSRRGKDPKIRRRFEAFLQTNQKLNTLQGNSITNHFKQTWENFGGKDDEDISIEQIKELLHSALRFYSKHPTQSPEKLALLITAQNFVISNKGREDAILYLKRESEPYIKAASVANGWVTSYAVTEALRGDKEAIKLMQMDNNASERARRMNRRIKKTTELINNLPPASK